MSIAPTIFMLIMCYLLGSGNCCFGGATFSVGIGTSGPYIGFQDSAGRGGSANLKDLSESESIPTSIRRNDVPSNSNGHSNEQITYHSVNEMRTSENGIAFLKRQEGFYEKEKGDPMKKIPTVGHGTNCKAHPDLCAQVPPSAEVTRELADNLLKQQLTNTVEKSIQRNVKVPLTQDQYDALASFTYHEGIGNFGSSTLLKKLNERDYKGAAEEFDRWDKITDPEDGKLKPFKPFADRRARERELFCTGGACDDKSDD